MNEPDLLPARVRLLVQQHVPTPAHLEALVTLAREPGRSRAPGEVALQKYPDRQVIRQALADLVASGALQAEGAGDEVRYRVHGDAELLATLALLVEAYDRVPVQLVRLVYARPSDAVQSFANAFRLQKPK